MYDTVVSPVGVSPRLVYDLVMHTALAVCMLKYHHNRIISEQSRYYNRYMQQINECSKAARRKERCGHLCHYIGLSIFKRNER